MVLQKHYSNKELCMPQPKVKIVWLIMHTHVFPNLYFFCETT